MVTPRALRSKSVDCRFGCQHRRQRRWLKPYSDHSSFQILSDMYFDCYRGNRRFLPIPAYLSSHIMDRCLSQDLPRKRCGASLTDRWTGCCDSCSFLPFFSWFEVIRHDFPDEACKFPCNCSHRYISFLSMAYHPVILASQSCTSSVRIGDDFCGIACLSGTKVL